MLFLRILGLATLVAWIVLPAPGRGAAWLGTVGDSLSEPYAEVDPSILASFLRPAGPGWPILGTPVEADPTPLNWVEQLPAARASELDVQNHARGGADTHTLLQQGQHVVAATEAAARIQAGERAFVSIGIGTNNFLPFGFPGQINTYAGIQNGCSSLVSCTSPFTGSNGQSYDRVDLYVADVLAEFREALDELEGSGAEVVVMGPGSWSSFPATSLSAGLAPNAVVEDAVDLLIREQRSEAFARGLPFVDYQLLLEDFPGLQVGGVALLPGHPAAGTRDPTHWFLPDGIHPDTIASGLVANAMLTALDLAYGAGLGLFTDAEILELAGLAPDPGWDGQSVDVGAYVFLPEADRRLQLGVAGLVALALAASPYRRRLRVARSSSRGDALPPCRSDGQSSP